MQCCTEVEGRTAGDCKTDIIKYILAKGGDDYGSGRANPGLG